MIYKKINLCIRKFIKYLEKSDIEHALLVWYTKRNKNMNQREVVSHEEDYYISTSNFCIDHYVICRVL